MRKIDKLLYRSIIPPFGIAFVVLSFVVFLNEFGRLSELLITRNASPETVAIIAGTILPSILVFSLPLSYLIGVLIGLSGLSGESQIVALRACGVPLRTLLRPIVAFASTICVLTAVLSLWVMPQTNDVLLGLKDRVSLRQAASQVQARVFNEDFPNIVFYVDDLSVGRQRWSGVFLSDNSDPNAPRTVLARNGSWVTDSSGSRLQLHLENGVIYEVDPLDPGRDKISLFSTTDVPIELSAFSGQDGGAAEGSKAPKLPARRRKPEEIRTSALWQGTPGKDRLARIEELTELHRRIAIPFSVIGFSLVGLALGISTRKGGRTSGFVISLVVVLFFYVSFLNGLRLARAEQLPPWLGAWAANLLTCSLGVFFMVVAERTNAVAHALGRWEWTAHIEEWLTRKRRTRDASGDYYPCDRTTSLSGRLLGSCFPRLMDVYVIRGFVTYFVWATLVCTLLFVLLTLFDLLDDIIRNNARIDEIIGYFVFLTPQILMLVVPMAVLLAILISFGILEKHSEITALKAGGWSLYRIAVPVFLTATGVCAGLYFIQDYILPYSNIRQDSLRNVIKGRSARTSARPQRKWVFGESNRIFNYDYFDAGQNLFVRLNIFEVDMKSTRVVRRLFADRATVTQDGLWTLENGWVRDFRDEDSGFHAITKEQFALAEKASYFQTEIFQPRESSKLSYIELNEYIRYLKKAGYNATELQVALYRKIAFPLSCVVMAILAIPFSFSMGRKGAFYGITVSISIAISYWGVFSLFEKMGVYGLLVPLLAAWAPNLLFAAAGLTLIFTIRT